MLNILLNWTYVPSFPYYFKEPCDDCQLNVGVQWLSGRVLDLRPRGHRFEPHWRHCVVVLAQDTFILA